MVDQNEEKEETKPSPEEVLEKLGTDTPTVGGISGTAISFADQHPCSICGEPDHSAEWKHDGTEIVNAVAGVSGGVAPSLVRPEVDELADPPPEPREVKDILFFRLADIQTIKVGESKELDFESRAVDAKTGEILDRHVLHMKVSRPTGAEVLVEHLRRR